MIESTVCDDPGYKHKTGQKKQKRAHYKNKPLQTPEERRQAKNERQRLLRAKPNRLKTKRQLADDAKRAHFIENWTQMKADEGASTSSKLITEKYALTQSNA